MRKVHRQKKNSTSCTYQGTGKSSTINFGGNSLLGGSCFSSSNFGLDLFTTSSSLLQSITSSSESQQRGSNQRSGTNSNSSGRRNTRFLLWGGFSLDGNRGRSGLFLLHRGWLFCLGFGSWLFSFGCRCRLFCFWCRCRFWCRSRLFGLGFGGRLRCRSGLFGCFGRSRGRFSGSKQLGFKIVESIQTDAGTSVLDSGDSEGRGSRDAKSGNHNILAELHGELFGLLIWYAPQRMGSSWSCDGGAKAFSRLGTTA